MIIGPLVAAFLGALVGAAASQGLREYLDHRQRRNELNGLLRLLDVETYRHRSQLDEYKKEPSWITDAPEHTLRFAEWDASKVRLSQLLSDDTQFADIAKYYENMREMDEFRRSSTDTVEWRRERVQSQLPTLSELHDLTKRHIRSHVPDAVTGTPLESLRSGEEG